MPGPLDSNVNQKDDLEFIRELERQSIDEIRKLRAHERFEAKISVVLRPANSSSRGNGTAQRGFTRDVSKGGCLAIFPMTVGVGDIFFFEFEDERIELPTVFGRCVRCRLVREDAFEASFAFFQDISLSELEAKEDENQSLL